MPKLHDASTATDRDSRGLHRCRWIVAAIALAFGGTDAPGATERPSPLLPTIVPLPPRRSDALAPVPAPPPAAVVPPIPAAPPPAPANASTEASKAATAPAANPDDVMACDRLLASGKVKAERQTSIAGSDGCGIAAPIRVAAIVDPRGTAIALEPPMTARCTFAEGFADWIRDDLVPLLGQRNGGLVKLNGTSGYECRGRNRVAGAKLSEHAAGDAVDIRSFVLADHTIADITKTADNKTLFAQVKATACVRFMTVLGPGSDGYHEDNLHLDLQYRRNGAHFCHWQLP